MADRGGRRSCAYRIVVEKSEGKIPLGRCSHRWKDNIRMDLKKIGWEDVEWSDLAQENDQGWAVVNLVTNLRVP